MGRQGVLDALSVQTQGDEHYKSPSSFFVKLSKRTPSENL
jgi:hypothetical protein